MLANEADFRHEVFNKFSAEYEKSLPAGRVNWSALLNVIAAVSPVSSTDSGFIDPAAEILGIRSDEVKWGIDQLERGGLLLRGGRLVRIVPDLLSDFLLEGACLMSSGDSTGFSDLDFTKFQAKYLANILRNLGELDWRITQRDQAQGARLLDGIWNEIEQTFQNADAIVRSDILKSLKQVAPFQPARVFGLIRFALKNEATSVTAFSIYSVTQEHVLQGVPRLLRSISYHLEYVPEAAEILWQLARADSRPPHQYPEHPFRVLEDMAAYEQYKLAVFNELIADFATEKSKNDAEFAGSFSPLDLADKLLVKEGEFSQSDGFQVTFGSLPINYPKVKSSRQKALAIIERCLNSDRPRIVMAALKIATRVLSGYLPMAPRSPSADELEWQMNERHAVLDMLDSLVSKSPPTPIALHIRSTLRRHRPYVNNAALADRIDEIAAKIGDTDELAIFQALSRGRYDLDDVHEPAENIEEARLQRVRRAADIFRDKYPDVPCQIAELVRMFKAARESGVDVGNSCYDFIEAICSAEFVEPFLHFLFEFEPPLELALMISVILRELRRSDLSRYREVGALAVAHANSYLAIGAADSIASGPNLKQPIAEDVALASALALHPDKRVRHLNFGAVRRLGEHKQHEQEAIEIVLKTDIGDDAELADEMCETFDHGIDKVHLSRAQVQSLTDKLIPTKNIEGFYVARFLSWTGQRFPEMLFDLTVRRLDREADLNSQGSKSNGYTPIPYNDFMSTFRSLQASPNLRTFLEQIAARLTAHPDQSFWLKELFWSMGSIDGATLGVIDELLHNHDPNSTQMALVLLEGAPSGLALSRPHFAVHVIDESGLADSQLTGIAESILIVNAAKGHFSRTPGEPSPKYLGMKEESRIRRDVFPAGSSGSRLFGRIHDFALERLNHERLDDEQTRFLDGA